MPSGHTTGKGASGFHPHAQRATISASRRLEVANGPLEQMDAYSRFFGCATIISKAGQKFQHEYGVKMQVKLKVMMS
jgi:hypothetical protein